VTGAPFGVKKNQPMKIRFKNPFLLPALIVGIRLSLAGRVRSQTFTTQQVFRGSEAGSSQLTNQCLLALTPF